jgi:hypothetical protein
LDESGCLFLPVSEVFPGRSGDDLYWIPADRIVDREVPDWLAQVAEKSWCSFRVLGGLTRALELLVGGTAGSGWRL